MKWKRWVMRLEENKQLRGDREQKNMVCLKKKKEKGQKNLVWSCVYSCLTQRCNDAGKTWNMLFELLGYSLSSTDSKDLIMTLTGLTFAETAMKEPQIWVDSSQKCIDLTEENHISSKSLQNFWYPTVCLSLHSLSLTWWRLSFWSNSVFDSLWMEQEPLLLVSIVFWWWENNKDLQLMTDLKSGENNGWMEVCGSLS